MIHGEVGRFNNFELHVYFEAEKEEKGESSPGIKEGLASRCITSPPPPPKKKKKKKERKKDRKMYKEKMLSTLKKI